MNDWTITSFQWKKQIADRYRAAGIAFDSEDTIYEKLYNLAEFLQRNQLTKQPLIKSKSQLGENFSIRASELTDEGVKLIRACHTKWVTKAKAPHDMTIMEQALRKLRTDGL